MEAASSPALGEPVEGCKRVLFDMGRRLRVTQLDIEAAKKLDRLYYGK